MATFFRPGQTRPAPATAPGVSLFRPGIGGDIPHALPARVELLRRRWPHAADETLDAMACYHDAVHGMTPDQLEQLAAGLSRFGPRTTARHVLEVRHALADVRRRVLAELARASRPVRRRPAPAPVEDDRDLPF